MSFISKSKLQLAQQIDCTDAVSLSTHLYSMLAVMLNTNSNGVASKKTQHLLAYCTQIKNSSISRKNYFLMVHFEYHKITLKNLVQRIKKLQLSLNETQESIIAMQKDINLGLNPNLNKEQAIQDIQNLKTYVTQTSKNITELESSRTAINEPLTTIKKYMFPTYRENSSAMRAQQKLFILLCSHV